MAQPLQHPTFRVVVFDRRGESLPRAEWPEYARRYDQDREWVERVARDGGPPRRDDLDPGAAHDPDCLALEWEPPPCDTELPT